MNASLNLNRDHLTKAVALAKAPERREIIADAIAMAMGAHLPDAHPFAIQLAQDGLITENVVRMAADLPRGAVARPALTTNDIVFTVGSAIRRFVANKAMPATEHRAALHLVRVQDFKQNSIARQLNTTLKPVSEGQILPLSRIAVTDEAVQVGTYAAHVPMTRQAIVNGDWPILADAVANFRRAAMRAERDELTALIAENPALSDGVAMFHADRGNLETGSIADGLVDNLGKMFAKLRSLPDGETTLEAKGKVLLIDAVSELPARTALRDAGMDDVIVIGSSALTNRAVLLPDPDDCPVFALASLSDDPQPRIEALGKKGADVIVVRASHDFAVAPVSPRAIMTVVS